MSRAAGQSADTARSDTCRFGPLTVSFDDRVLVPRQWTLMQSNWAAELAVSGPDGALLELCAGAGHIGLAAAVVSDHDLVQVEADPVAAEFARRNAVDAGFGDRVDLRNARLEAALTTEEKFAVVIADPPYLPTAMVDQWPEDPVFAIDGGADGLDVVRDCLVIGAQHLVDGGALLLQVAGGAQAEAVVAWVNTVPELGLRHLETRSHDPERAVVLFGRSL